MKSLVSQIFYGESSVTFLLLEFALRKKMLQGRGALTCLLLKAMTLRNMLGKILRNSISCLAVWDV